MGYGNQGYGQSNGYQNRGGYQQRQPSVTKTVKGVLDFVEEKTTQAGRTYWSVGIAGQTYSVWDTNISDVMEEGQSGTAIVSQSGKYWNIKDWTPGDVQADAPRKIVGFSGNGNAREDYWQRKFEFETTIGHESIVKMNAIGNARQIVKDLKDLGLLNLDKYAAGKKTPQEMYLAAVYDLADDIASHVSFREESEAPSQNDDEEGF
jgi:hypothetical protein